MRSHTSTVFAHTAGSKCALVAALALFLAAFVPPLSFGQGGGITAPESSGVPTPDPAPTPAQPAPDAAPGADSDGVEAAPSPQTSPAPATLPDTTSSPPEASSPGPAASQQAAPPAGQPPRRAAGKRARQHKARARRSAPPEHRRSTAGRASPARVFGLDLPLVGGGDIDTDAESPPVELIAWALLSLVLAAAALLALTARLSRMEGLTGPVPQVGEWLDGISQIVRFAQRGTGRHPAS